MNYGLELSRILDKCNLTKDERIALEKFLDGKVFQDREIYPEYEKSLNEMIKEYPLLSIAQKKIHNCGQWANLMKLIIPLNLSQKFKNKQG